MKAAFVLVRCHLGKLEEVANALMEIEGVSEVHSITGAWDLLVKLYAPAYEAFVRTCKLGPRGLEEEAAWIERYRQIWAARFDELDIVVEELKRKEKANGRKKRR